MKEIDVVCGAIQIDDKFLIARRSKGADPGFSGISRRKSRTK